MELKKSCVILLSVLTGVVQPILAAENGISSVVGKQPTALIRSDSHPNPKTIDHQEVSTASDSDAANKAIQKNKRSLSDTPSISNSIISNAFNYGAKGSFQVDPRTGSLSMSFTLASLWANGLHGAVMPLQIEYNGATDYQYYQVAKGWSFDLPYVDVTNSQVIFPSARYKLLNSNTDLQYGKLQDKQFGFTRLSDNSGYQYVVQNGTTYLFSSDGLLQSITNPLGFSVHFSYQGKKLTNMYDNYGHQIKVSYDYGSTSISYEDANGQWQTNRLMLDGNSRVIAITDPLGESSHIQYYDDSSNYAGMPKLLTNPIGATVLVEYKTIEGVSSFVNMPVVDKVSTRSNSYYPSAMGGGAEMNEPLVTTYSYSNSSSDHNFLGHGLMGGTPSTEDPMMEASISDPGYTYQTSQTTKTYGQYVTTTSTYDHFHRLMKQQIIVAGKVISENTNTYNDTTSTPYSYLSAAYNSPEITKTIIHGINGLYDVSSIGQSTSESFEYDTNGLQTKHIDKYGITTETKYANPNDSGFTRLSLQQVTIPAGISGLKALKPRVVANKVKTLVYNNMLSGKDYKLDEINQSAYGTLNTDTSGQANLLGTDENMTVEKIEDKTWSHSGSASYLLQSTSTISNAAHNLSSQTTSNVENPESMDLNLSLKGNTKANLSDANNISDTNDSYVIISHKLSSENSSMTATEKSYLSRYNGQVMMKEDANGFKTFYTYDPLGRVLTETDNYGTAEASTIHYDYAIAQGSATLTATHPDGFKERVTYDSLGRQIFSEQSANNNPNEWISVAGTKYNIDGSTSEDIDYSTGDGLSTQYSYTPYGKKSLVKNPDGSADANVYDLNRGTLIQYHLISNGLAVSNAYSACHLPGTQTTTGCQVAAFDVKHYNNNTKQINSYVFQADPSAKHADGTLEYSSTDQASLTSLASSFSDGNPAMASTLADFIDTATNQNEYYTSNLVQLNGFSEYNEGDDDNPKHEIAYTIDNQGNRLNYTYNSDGQQTSEQDISTGNLVTAAYDYLGNLTQLSENSSNQDYILGQNSYDGLGQMQTSTNGSGNQESYTYYADQHKGHPETTTTANGDVIHYTYDDLDRPLTSQVGDITTYYTYQSTYPYLLSGTEMQSSAGSSKTTYTYDLYQNPVSTTVSYNNGSASNTFTNTYDKYGIKQSGSDQMTDVSTSFKYDALGQVIEKDYGNGHITKYIYNAQNQLQDKIVDQVDHHYNYNNLGQITNLTVSSSLNTNTMSFNYQYDDEGRILSESDDHITKSYQYSKLGQLSNYICSEKSLPMEYCPQDGSGKSISSSTYTYDKLNNQTAQVNQYEDGTTGQTTFSYTNMDPTQLSHYQDSATDINVSFNYDHNGNMLNDQNNNQLSYDPLDNIKTVTNTQQVTTNYLYNAEGQQIQEQQGSDQPLTYFYNDGIISDESQYSNTTNLNQTTHYVDGGQINNGQWNYSLADMRNNVISHMDSQGNMSDYNTYLPFGYSNNIDPKAKTFSVLDITQLDQGFNGEVTDRVTGNQFLGQGYRAYNPVLHRFMKHDSDSPYGDGGFNGYIYVGNDPINGTDPTGHMSKVGKELIGIATILVLTGLVIATGGAAAPAAAVADATVVAAEVGAADATVVAAEVGVAELESGSEIEGSFLTADDSFDRASFYTANDGILEEQESSVLFGADEVNSSSNSSSLLIREVSYPELIQEENVNRLDIIKNRGIEYMKGEDSRLTDGQVKDFFRIVDENLRNFPEQTKRSSNGAAWDSLMDVTNRFSWGDRFKAGVKNLSNIKSMIPFEGFVRDQELVNTAQEYAVEFHRVQP